MRGMRDRRIGAFFFLFGIAIVGVSMANCQLPGHRIMHTEILEASPNADLTVVLKGLTPDLIDSSKKTYVWPLFLYLKEKSGRTYQFVIPKSGAPEDVSFGELRSDGTTIPIPLRRAAPSEAAD